MKKKATARYGSLRLQLPHVWGIVSPAGKKSRLHSPPSLGWHGPGLSTDCVCRYGNWPTAGAEIRAQPGGREILSRTEATGSKRASRNGGEWTGSLVRAPAGRAAVYLWIGDAAEIRTKRVRKQKTDRRDAQLLLRLLLEDRFPRIWVPSWRNRDLRQLLWHRHRLVQMRTRLMNQLQAVALNEGVRRKKGLWREAGRKQLEGFALAPWASPLC